MALMATRQVEKVLRHVRTVLARHGAEQQSDRELLRRFAQGREEEAFAELVRRHGPMVLAVCRRVLHHRQDAEDAFQAAFLVLARKAKSRGWHESIANWLYLVARRLAQRLRAQTCQRREREARSPDDAPVDVLETVSGRELCAAVDEELTRLPERYRAGIVLCCLEGRTRDEAARQLGWSSRVLKRRTAAISGTAPSASVGALVETFLAGAISTRLRVVVAVLLAACVAGGVGLGAGGRQPAVGDRELVESRGPTTNDREPKADRHGDPLPTGVVARLGTIRFRHQNTVRAVAYSRDGTRLISASWDGTMRVWDAETGRELHRFRQPEASSAAIAPDGKTVASGGMDKSLHVWDLTTGKELLQVGDLENSVMALQFAPDGKSLATLSSPIIRIWDLTSGKETARFTGPAKGVYSIAFSSDGKLLAGGCEDKTVRIWDTGSGKELRRLEGHADLLYGVAFAPDGKTLASSGRDGDRTIRLWDVATGQEKLRIPGAPGWVRPIAFSPDGKLLASGGQNSVVFILEAATGEELRHCRLPGRDDTWVMALAFSPDGKRLATSGSDMPIRLWDPATGKEIQPYEGHQASVSQVAVSADGSTIWSAGDDGMLCRWDRATGRVVWRARQSATISNMVVSADGKRIVTTGLEPEMARLWDAATGRELRRFRGPKGWIRAIALSPDASILALAAWDRTIRFLDTANGKEHLVIRLPALNADFRGDCPLVFTPDGKTLISGNADSRDSILYVWNTTTGKQLRQIKQPTLRLAVSPDGRILATTGRDGVLHLYDIATGQELRRIEYAGDCVVFAPDGRCLASGDSRGVVHLWELATGRERRRLTGHESLRQDGHSFGAGVTTLAFSGDGKTLITGGNDTTILIWDLHATQGERRSLDALWAAMGEADASHAYDAMCQLAGSRSETVDFLKSHLPVAAPPNPLQTARLIADLDSEQFAIREKASAELAKLGESALPLLHKELARDPSPEVSRRIKALVEKATNPETSSDLLHGIRAIEVLEHLATPEARQLLQKLVGGAPDARLTSEANAALERLKRR
jgi:RNA polymerase sigma factor (sigma-70 family)